MKSRRPQIAPLNSVCIAHLLAIRTERQRIFEWKSDTGCFHDWFHRLETRAGIPRSEHFGTQRIRQTLGSCLWEHSPGAASCVLGHATMEVTRKHYIAAKPIIARALAALPQPAAFTEALGASAS
jgi:integrase